MFLAEGEAGATTSTFAVFDLFILAFTVLIAWGIFRSLRAEQKNKFAIGFGVVALLVFLFMDVIAIKGWMA